MDPKKLPKNQASEVYADGRSRNQPGVYFHKESGKYLTALTVPAADAFVRLGFVYEGPVGSVAAANPKPEAAETAKPKAQAKAKDKTGSK